MRAAVRGHGLGYVLQIAANRRVRLPSTQTVRVDQLPALVPAQAWQRHSAGVGTKGPRWYSWAWIQLAPEPNTTSDNSTSTTSDNSTSTTSDNSKGAVSGQPATSVHHVLLRRNESTGELAFHLCYSPQLVPLHTLVTVAGQRWRIEESFHAAKGLVGLDQHQVRHWTPGTGGPPWPCSPTPS